MKYDWWFHLEGYSTVGNVVDELAQPDCSSSSEGSFEVSRLSYLVVIFPLIKCLHGNQHSTRCMRTSIFNSFCFRPYSCKCRNNVCIKSSNGTIAPLVLSCTVSPRCVCRLSRFLGVGCVREVPQALSPLLMDSQCNLSTVCRATRIAMRHGAFIVVVFASTFALLMSKQQAYLINSAHHSFWF